MLKKNNLVEFKIRFFRAAPIKFIETNHSKIFWALLLLIFTLGLLLRIFWTFTLGIPYFLPDSWSYLAPALNSPALPISEIRTVGVPYLVALGLISFKHPIGILIIHNLLWIVSTLAITLTLASRLELKFLSLLTLFYLCFVNNNLSFEYLLLSEHLSRTLYLIYFVLIISSIGRSLRIWSVTLTAIIIYLNILSKPSAIILVPVTIVLYFAVWFWQKPKQSLQKIGISAFLICLLVGSGLVAYGYAFKAKMGNFGFSYFAGYNLFCHVGHLVDLNSETYPELMKDLREYMPLYTSKYAARKEYYCNWLVFGSTNDELKADFGDRSPVASVRNYLESQSKPTSTKEINKVFQTLAKEAIKVHPIQYLQYAFDRALYLINYANSSDYFDYLQTISLERHQNDIQTFKDYIKRQSQANIWIIDRMKQEILSERDRMGNYQNSQVLAIWQVVESFYGAVFKFIYKCLRGLQYFSILSIPLISYTIPFIFFPTKGKRSLVKLKLIAIFSAIITATYALFLGGFNTADVLRFIVNIQDIIVIGEIAILIYTVMIIQRTLYFLYYRYILQES